LRGGNGLSNESTNTANITTSTSANYGTNGATKNGTRIVKPGSDMDKNAFLKILAAELSNQDPMAAKDSTQYVSQMAQFASMEQMTNLNTTMSSNAANSLIGKGVVTKVKDATGVTYAGVVRDVTNNSGKFVVGVEVSDGSTTKILDFDYNEIATVAETPNYSMDNLSTNTALLAAANMIGKTGEFNLKDSNNNNLQGLIKGVVKENGLLKLRVQPNGSNEIKIVTLDTLVKLDMVE
jgi:flagellar basal-body rod modification protein FlgD